MWTTYTKKDKEWLKESKQKNVKAWTVKGKQKMWDGGGKTGSKEGDHCGADGDFILAAIWHWKHGNEVMGDVLRDALITAAFRQLYPCRHILNSSLNHSMSHILTGTSIDSQEKCYLPQTNDP